ncbi:DUF3955 domain-containing protein [Enterococcus sp.]|uniref:DUF3955 domain-containing protein n=1 Tax=Enterococcus sp. TaxID=35783 RepID=UPI002FC9E5DB
MEFNEQLKVLRKERSLTQEQLANELNVSRQAISNWENNKNLPDLEMVVTIAQLFDLSLDELILGGKEMTNMAEKLINDGSETRRAKMNLISISIGAVLFLMGVACLLIKSVSVEYIDAQGFLHENFFLIPIAFLLMFSGILVFAITGFKSLRFWWVNKYR